jgi:heavy metal translocating P-type ATPase
MFIAVLFFSGLVCGGAVYAIKKLPQPENSPKKIRNNKTKFNQSTRGSIDEQNQPLQTVAFNSKEDKVEKETNHYLAVSSFSFAMAAAGALFFPPFTLLSIFTIGYIAFPVFKAAYESIFKERKLRIVILNSIGLLVGIATSYYLLSALTGVIYFSAAKLLNKTKNKTRKSIINVFKGQPTSVWLLKDGVEVSVPLKSILVGDTLVVNASEIISVDGIITQGLASIDQHRLTGEAQPEEKTTGDNVFATTLVLAGCIYIRVEKTGAETITAHIGEILNKTTSFEEALQTRGEKIADGSVAPTLGIGAIALTMLGTHGGLTVLCSNFSDILFLTTPLSMWNYLRIASQNGCFIKDGRSLELLKQVDTIVFDKTGTLTLEQSYVKNIYPCNGFSEEELLRYAATAEYKQNHPIAKAILSMTQQRNLTLPQIDEAQYEIGYGIKVHLEGQIIRVGSDRFMSQENITIPSLIQTRQADSHEQGSALVYVAIDNQLGGVLELQPTIRPEAKRIVQLLQKRGLAVYIISGDHEQPTRRLAQELGIDNYFSETLPEDKAKLVEQLQAQGKSVCFIGDGINDSIALKKATVSISLRGASTVATDTAQIILMDKTLNQLKYVFELADKFDNNRKRGIATSAIPTIVCAGGAFFLNFGVFYTLFFYNLSAVMGVINAMLPLTKEEKKLPVTTD